jgi:hypothetical protein
VTLATKDTIDGLKFIKGLLNMYEALLFCVTKYSIDPILDGETKSNPTGIRKLNRYRLSNQCSYKIVWQKAG